MERRQVCSDRILIFTNKVLYPRPGLGLPFVVTVGWNETPCSRCSRLGRLIISPGAGIRHHPDGLSASSS